ncbi:histone-lysine N-methyltransferase PRDM7-like [Sphaerodactylus townsendi]|uniref:histone-lysine N-methyltransferase PRDM7-like n=1 Tax=Sphaerodactylus townsendi TaxID=933632 RepID=UPI002026DB19|nr:histone-lysine N-methyltransferase PRDM7-like [Sphaerodactylus townsendi]
MSTEREAQGLKENTQELKGEMSDKTEAQGRVGTEHECQGTEGKMATSDPRGQREKSLKDGASEASSSHSLLTKNTEAGGMVSGPRRGSSGDKNSTERDKTQTNKKGQKPKTEDAFKQLSIYFPKEQWAEMGDWEKIRYKNMKENYDFMTKLGLSAPKPAFMYYVRQSRKSAGNDSSESDEEWTPKPLALETCLGDTPEGRREDLPRKIDSEKRDPEKRGQNKPGSTYSLRKRENKTYMEINEPNDDDFLYCEYCLIFFTDECSVHGPPVFIKDAAAEIGLEKRAALTLPPGLRIGPSGIPNAGLGVWNEGEVLLAGTHFGPYEGEMTEEEEAANSGYSWLITKGKNSYVYVDGKEETVSNWMRYVNCARNEEEQNLVAFQYHGKIFYRACKIISLHSELLVWYGEEYGKELCIKWGSRWKSQRGRAQKPAARLLPSPLGRAEKTAILCPPSHVFINTEAEDGAAHAAHGAWPCPQALPPASVLIKASHGGWQSLLLSPERMAEAGLSAPGSLGEGGWFRVALSGVLGPANIDNDMGRAKGA